MLKVDRIRALCEAKGWRFRPWETAPWDANAGASPYPPHTMGATTWPKAQALRRKLIAELERR